MKKIILIFVSFYLMTAMGFAQTPQAFKYQAVARTSTGNLIQNQLVAFRISLLQGGPSGTLVYQERHTTNTNNYGLANLDIGNGTVLSGSFSVIDWSAGTMFIKVEFDPLGGTAYQNMGTTQLLSVPYALHSKTSSDLTLPYSGTVSSDASALSITNTGTGYGISGTAYSTGGYGVIGQGYIGTSGFSQTGTGVFGSGVNGVKGTTNIDSGNGVYGVNGYTTGLGSGVLGETYSLYGYGVYGMALSATGIAKAVSGFVVSPEGFSGSFLGGKFYVEQNVGIGTSIPDCQLSVKAPSSGSMDVVNIKKNNGTNLFRLRQSSNGSGGLYIYDGSNTNTVFLYGEGNSFINGGNLGIGTNSPAYKLDVAGTINLNKGIGLGIAMQVNGDEALWYNGTYFSWGYGGTFNVFDDPVGINCGPGEGHLLAVNGVASKPGGGVWTAFSDIRLKDVNGPYISGLNEIIQLQPVRYNYKQGNELALPSDKEYFGFIAQDVQKVFPESITETTSGYLEFDMQPVNVALINAIKELKAENDKLKAEIENINARFDKFEASMSLSATK